ncbi:MAG TPA: hypothetical protein VF396_07180 [Bradyrhizobium sp.]
MPSRTNAAFILVLPTLSIYGIVSLAAGDVGQPKQDENLHNLAAVMSDGFRNGSTTLGRPLVRSPA